MHRDLRRAQDRSEPSATMEAYDGYDSQGGPMSLQEMLGYALLGFAGGFLGAKISDAIEQARRRRR